jgi:GDP-L-fucose synthase
MYKVNLKDKKIAISGGSGFLGKRIVHELEKRGAQVIAPRRKDYDFLSETDSQAFFKENSPEVFIHSAALYGGLGIIQRIPAEIFDYNMRMMLNIFKASIDWDKNTPKLEKMVAIGSACAYPSKLETNMREELMWEGPIDESVRNYGGVKRLMETTGQLYRDQFNLHSINLQLATLYGEGDTFNPDRSHVPAALIRKIVEAKQENKPFAELWGVPDTVRECMYVGDVAKGIVKATEYFEGVESCKDQSKYTLNLGTGKGITIDFLANTIKEIVDYSGDLKYTGESPGQKEKSLVVDRMKTELNWYPENSLKEGMEKTIKWYISNKEEADNRF